MAVARQLDPSYPIEPGVRGVNVVYQINLKDANTYFVARNMTVQNKDMIYVAASLSNDFYKAMQLFNTMAGPVTTGLVVAKI